MRELILKMLLLGILVIPAILAVPNELKIDDYSITIESDTLMSVSATQRSSTELNLTGLGIKRIDKNAFKNVDKIKFLNLANNSLIVLPQSAFSNLTNLEHLSLVNNNITRFKRAFVGLEKLKLLDMSNNPLTSFKRGQLYGLSRSVDIITRGVPIKKIFNALYDNEDVGNVDDDDDDDDDDDNEDNDDIDNGGDDDNYCEDGPSTPGLPPYFLKDPTFRVKVCIVQDRMMLVEHMDEGDVLPSTCREVKHYDCCSLYLNNFGIKSFEKGWYQVKDVYYRSISTIILTDNNISRVTEEMLNDLPSGIRTVDLSKNQITKLERRIIRNYNIRNLYINDNLIEEIEDDTFENMKLFKLMMNGNRLLNTNFLVTIPRALSKLCINRNQIKQLDNLPILRFFQLSKLYMRNNSITVVRKNALRGLSLLLKLDLTNNRIKTLEPGCFRSLIKLRYLRLRGNEIANFDGDVFEELIQLVELDLGRNKLTKISSEFRDSLPNRLQTMHLDYNLINSLEPGTFVNVPKKLLNLQGNSISTIAKGSFVVPHLYGADVSRGALDLAGIRPRLLPGNHFATFLLELMPKRSREGIGFVDLSKNPIRRLENGALYGITKGSQNGVHLSKSPIELIQGGLFDDV